MLSETNSNLIRWWLTTIGSVHLFESMPSIIKMMMVAHSTSTNMDDDHMSSLNLPTTVLSSTSTLSTLPTKLVSKNHGHGHIQSTIIRPRFGRDDKRPRHFNVGVLMTFLILILLFSCFGGCWAHLISGPYTTTTNSIDIDSGETGEEVTSTITANDIEGQFYRTLASTAAPSNQLREPQNLIIDHSPIDFDGEEYRKLFFKFG